MTPTGWIALLAGAACGAMLCVIALVSQMAGKLRNCEAEVRRLRHELQCSNDASSDFETQLDMIAERLCIAAEPHQFTHERVLCAIDRLRSAVTAARSDLQGWIDETDYESEKDAKLMDLYARALAEGQGHD